MRKLKKYFRIILAGIIVSLIVTYFPVEAEVTTNSFTDFINNSLASIFNTTDSIYEKVHLIAVVDGDTIIVKYNGTETKVRMIGIDTPESVHSDESKNTKYGKIASDYTKALLSNAEYVYLEFDVEKYDTYDRLLAYIYLEDAQDFDESINNHLVSIGYAINKEYPPNTKYAYELDMMMSYAKANNIGFWAENLWE